MKQLSLVLLLAAFGLGMAACSKSRPGKPKVLVFTKTAGFRHASIPEGIKAIQQLGQANGFDVDTTENAARFTEDSLQQYSAVIFLNTTGDVLDNRQEADFERYIQSGGGFVGIHAATDTEYDWPWYGKMVGAYFNGHPEGMAKAKLVVTDKSHGSTKDLPDTWEHTDEWYNFKNFNKETKVLIKVDEKTYKGGTMGDDHPISWYHEYDGGRAFYTELGHTTESYTEDNYLKHVLGGIQYAIGKNLVLDYAKATSLRVPDEDRFTRQVLAGGEFFEPTEMAILPNLDVLVAQRRGEILLYNNATKALTQVGFLNVYHKTDVPKVNAEEGLMGLAADPDFAKNNFIYAFYSPADTSVNRLSRFEFKNNKVVPESEKVILQFYSQRQICCHTGGSITFGSDGLLYLSTGDNTTPFDEPGQPYVSKGYGPVDDRPGHLQYDGRRTSSNTNDLRGKILRIRVKADGSYEIPEGNLFKASDKTKPEIYAMGTRNPYRISVDPKTNYLYWGEVGPDAANDDSTRGPRGYDEVNQAKKAGYYGYPLFIADNKPYRAYNYETGESGPYNNPEKPINNSRNNTGLTALPPAQKAFIWYPYAKSEEFPLVGSGGRNAEAGPVYYSDLYPAATRFPDYYNGKLFIYDWIRGWVMAVTMDKDGNYQKMEKFMPSTKFNAPIDMEMGPDGRMYVLEYGKGWFSKNPDAALVRIDYNGGNRAPKTGLKVDKITGSLPFKVKLEAEGATDPDGDAITFVWNFGNGTTKETKEPFVEQTYTVAGEYPVFVDVTDSQGATVRSKMINVYAGNETPEVQINLAGNSMFYFPGKQVQYNVVVKDKEDSVPDPANLYIKGMYIEGKDKAAMPQGHQIVSGTIAGKNIIESSDCRTCHKPDEKSIGPSFMDIAGKYKDDPKSPDYLAQKIIKGGGGVWGETVMAAHPTISTGEAKQIVEYIFSLAGKARQEPSLPASGSVSPTMGGELKDGGILYLMASYTDKGGAGIRPITGLADVELRNPRFQAENYKTADGAAVVEISGMKLLIPTANAVVRYKDMDLATVNGIELTYFIQEQPQHGYTVSAHLDKPDGEKLGEVNIGAGARKEAPNTAVISFPARADNKRRSLYLVFKADAAEKAPVGIDVIKLLSR
ncbi:Crp/Fnr family transcriptional regulator [Chitinophaga alhagiae]|uniref:Crp/Fnr family transcriptional regulator n=1 Tax=Chitinophaga alhagiae TaxID=2203219 RepID=A0ABM6WAE1_9BACT|nr:ThuA domain-containing protein [Chitinophaga alhagiae]AWO00948.1 Crp/Fnr family transcriptional regulator [Chitinophaga alhagiae]